MTGARMRVWQRSITLTAGADQLTDHIVYRLNARKDFRSTICLAAVTNEHHRAIVCWCLMAQ
jgi:hypothetical protein